MNSLISRKDAKSQDGKQKTKSLSLAKTQSRQEKPKQKLSFSLRRKDNKIKIKSLFLAKSLRRQENRKIMITKTNSFLSGFAALRETTLRDRLQYA
jgi:hypothetical protein